MGKLLFFFSAGFTGGGFGGGAHKPQATLTCHRCLGATNVFETDRRSTGLIFGGVCGGCVDESLWTDGR